MAHSIGSLNSAFRFGRKTSRAALVQRMIEITVLASGYRVKTSLMKE